MQDAKISFRYAAVAVCLAIVGGLLMGYGLFSTGPDRAERERIAELDARNAELEQRLNDNNSRARELIDGMAVNLERQLQLATDTADLVGALREVLEGLQDYYDSLGGDYSDSDTVSYIDGGD